ncbi:hypothetical protein [Burkholderia sp. BCC1630]|uniref:hypothetical protein n=1 Tax=Burkholderia sp. BCC1630 TaxID=2676304 RepID=UPI00158D4D55|nr:hypothetical protein [Burkholderia sp. BCC1630]
MFSISRTGSGQDTMSHHLISQNSTDSPPSESDSDEDTRSTIRSALKRIQPALEFPSFEGKIRREQSSALRRSASDTNLQDADLSPARLRVRTVSMAGVASSSSHTKDTQMIPFTPPRESDIPNPTGNPESVTTMQTANAMASGTLRATVAQIAGHAAGIGVDIGVQSLPNTAAYWGTGIALVPLSAALAGGYMGHRYAQHHFPLDPVRRKLYAGFGAVLAGGVTLTVLPLSQPSACLAGVAGALNSMSSSWVNAGVTSLLRGLGGRMKLQFPESHEGGWALLAPWVGSVAGAFGAVGSTLLRSSRTVLGGLEAALHGAVIGSVAKSVFETLAARWSATSHNACVYAPHQAVFTRPDARSLIRGAWSTATVGIPNIMSSHLKKILHSPDEGRQTYDVCSAIASSVSGNLVSKIGWGLYVDAPQRLVRQPRDVETGDQHVEHTE